MGKGQKNAKAVLTNGQLTFTPNDRSITIPWEFSAAIAYAYVSLFGVEEMVVE
jgi:hypothetical protein